jgi:large subunit ribosomal protein L5
MASVIQEKFSKEIAPALQKKLGLKNSMQVPTIQKIVLNTCISEAVKNPKILDTAAEQLGAITGQKPVITKAKKAISNFKSLWHHRGTVTSHAPA